MNEIEKAIDDLDDLKNCDSISSSHFKDVHGKHLELAITALTEKLNGGWIPCSERLPERKKIVLQVTIIRISDNYKWVQNLLWDYDEWKRWEEDKEKVDESSFNVLAWQPLPTKYTEEK